MFSQYCRRLSVAFTLLFTLLLLSGLGWAAPPGALEQERIAAVLPGVTSISEQEGEFGVRTLKQGDEIVGYAFETINIAPIPAYSGKPMNMQVILGPEGNIQIGRASCRERV